MRVIEEGEERLCFLVDDDKRLKKVVSDGDIRRALLAGAALDECVKDIHSRRPYVINEENVDDDARQLLSKRISVIPVIDHFGHVKGIMRFHDVNAFIDIRSRQVLVLGLGYVGLTLALVLADVGFEVIGYDRDLQVLDKLKKKKATFFEKGLDNYLFKNVGNNLILTSSLDKVVADIHIITVGTPIIKTSMRPNIDYIKNATTSIGSILKRNDLVILRSTVPLGLTRNVVLPLLEQVSGLKVGDDFFLAFCPERTTEGRALKELYSLPQIVGGYDVKSTELASRLFNENTSTVIDAGSLEAAEMCKLMDNTFRDTVFAYANQMAQLCEKVGLDLTDLVDKVNLGYHRNMIPKPSPGVGGACLSKDPYILMQDFHVHDLDCSLIESARKINESAPKSIYDNAEKLLTDVGKTLKTANVFIIGFAFKGNPETADLRDSTTLWFLGELKRQGVGQIHGYDAVVADNELTALGVTPVSIEDGFNQADAIFIMNNHDTYANLHIFELLETTNQPAVFFDGWRTFRPADMRNISGIMYIGIGVG